MKSLSQFGIFVAFFAIHVESVASLRQRIFIHDGQGSTRGTEAIVRWNFKNRSPGLFVHNWGSGSLGSSSTLNFSTVSNILGASLAQWTQGTLGLQSPLSLGLSGGSLTSTNSACETDSIGELDGKNNFLFSSKIDSSCSDPIPSNSGIIGLTKARYQPSSGEIVEVDLQFDDRNFKFTASGTNNPIAGIMNLNDVAVHEIGHFFGLDHVPVRNSSMVFAIGEDLEFPKNEDYMGLFSLYPPTNASTSLGGLRGSLLDTNGSPVFGAMIFLVNPRTMEIAASEISDVNGAYEFCAVPAGPYIIFANRYMPYGLNVHEYYSGDGAGYSTYKKVDNKSVFCSNVSCGDNTVYCTNPSCEVMTRSIRHSFLSKAPSGTGAQGGLAMKLVNVAAGTTRRFVNLAATGDVVSLSSVGGTVSSAGSTLTLDEPRLARLSESTIPLSGSGSNLGTDVYAFVAPTSGHVLIRLASLRLYTRLVASLSVFESSGASLISGSCVGYPESGGQNGSVDPAVDPGLSCTGLVAGSTYHLRITGTGTSCRNVPGNKIGNTNGSCESASVGEDATTPYPYYMINVFAAADEVDLTKGDQDVFAASSLAANTWTGMPTCAASVGNVSSGSKGGGCCGSLGQNGPKPPSALASFVLSLLLSPLVWFVGYWGLRRRVAIA